MDTIQIYKEFFDYNFILSPNDIPLAETGRNIPK